MRSHEDVKKWYLDTVSQTTESRAQCERDRDYYDNKQWTDAEVTELKKRKQPVITVNRIKPKIDALIGLEISSRVDIKAFPRTPNDEESADAATDSLRYVADNSDFDQVKTDAAYNLFIEGTMAGIVEVEQTAKGFEIKPRHIPWDRFFIDKYATRKDGRDAKFMGQAIWMDMSDAVATFPNKESVLEGTDEESGDTYDDKPKNVFYDSTRKRVKVIEMFYHDGGWKHVIFTGLGEVVESRPSPYKDEDGAPMNPIEVQAAFIDRDNNHYSPVRQMISIQDEINKRRSKSMHLLSVRQTIAQKGAVDNVNAARRELAKPDGFIEVNGDLRFEIQNTSDLAMGQLNLLQEAKGEIDAIGANAAVTGKEERNLSGRAMQVRQQAGAVELTPVLDGLRSWERRMYRQMWARVRQFWTEEKWIRVTDDEKNMKFVGLNRPVTMGEMLEQKGEMFDANDPRMSQVVDIQNPVAELDVDIVLDAVPDMVNLQAEQFELLANMYQANPQAVPFDMIIESSSLRNKDRILERMSGGTPEEQQINQAKQQQAEQIALMTQQTDIEGEKAKARKDNADAEAQEIENFATKTGITDIVERLNGQAQ